MQLFRNHLRLILLHEFPEHYGEVLSAVLRGSESQNLSLDVWRDLLAALSSKPKNIAPCQNPPKIRDEIRHYATEQRLLSRQEVRLYVYKKEIFFCFTALFDIIIKQNLASDMSNDTYFRAISDARYRCASKPTLHEREIAIWIIRAVSEI